MAAPAAACGHRQQRRWKTQQDGESHGLIAAEVYTGSPIVVAIISAINGIALRRLMPPLMRWPSGDGSTHDRSRAQPAQVSPGRRKRRSDVRRRARQHLRVEVLRESRRGATATLSMPSREVDRQEVERRSGLTGSRRRPASAAGGSFERQRVLFITGGSIERQPRAPPRGWSRARDTADTAALRLVRIRRGLKDDSARKRGWKRYRYLGQYLRRTTNSAARLR